MRKITSKIYKTGFLAFALICSSCSSIGGGTSYNITVNNGTGGGTYFAGSVVTINATIPQYKDFSYWELDGKNVSTDNPYTFTATQNATYTAVFKSQTATVTVNNGTGGGTFDKGSTATITATVPENYEFDYWSAYGGKASSENPYSFTVTRDVTYTAVFKKQQVRINVVNGTGGGTYDKGSKATISATIPSGQLFDYWSVDGVKVSNENPYTITANGDVTYTANFKDRDLNIQVVNGTGSGTYAKGTSVTITANEPPLDKAFDYWELDGESVSTQNPYTFTVTNDATYTAIYKTTFRGVKRTDTSPIVINTIEVSKGGTITVDYRYVNPTADASKGVSILLGNDTANSYGQYKIFFDRLDSAYNGVTIQELSDGYYRLTFVVSKLDKVSSGASAPTNIDRLLFSSFEPTQGVYFDVKTETVKSEARGYVYSKASEIAFGKTYTVSEGGTIVVDYKYVDPVADVDNGVSMFYGTDDTHRFGNYKILHDHLETTYNGISFIKLDDGYHRMTINIAKLDKVRSGETAPTEISKILFKWFEPDYGIYYDINPLDKLSKTTTFQISGSKFKIANFTDIHIDDVSMLSDTGTVGKTIKYGIQRSKPDILTFSGDIASNSARLDALCTYLDGFKIPYFFILGNHDREGSMNYNVFAQRLELSSYGYIEKGPEDFGTHFGNYTIKINNNQGQLVHALFMMDTGNKQTITDYSNVEYFTGTKVSGVKYGTFNNKTTYCDGTSSGGNAWDGLNNNQITWYKNTATALNCENTLICHAGFNEYVKAFEQYQDAVNKKDQAAIAACEPIGQCNMGEQVCGTVENLGLFDAIKVSGTKNVICGHDHANDFSLLYQGVRLTYALKTGDGAYWSGGNRSGYTELIIDNTGKTTLDQIYFNPLS